MRDGADRGDERIASAGADLLRIVQSRVLVVTDEPAGPEPWCHPAWPLCRGLGALGFAGVELWGAGACADDFEEWMEGFAFLQVPAPGARLESAAPWDVALHLGGDATTRETCARLARERGAAFAPLTWGRTWVEMTSPSPSPAGVAADVRSAAPAPEPAAPIARIAAGLALQESLIAAGLLLDASPPAPRLGFDAAAETRALEEGRGAGGSEAAWPAEPPEDAVVEVIGAGAVGTHLLEALAPLLGPGCELRIFDFDAVGPENLALQACFSPADVGRPKAVVMAERLAAHCDPELHLRPLVVRYEERPASLGRPHLRVACPDSFAARKHANDRSLDDGVPLVEAGSSPLSAQQRSYVPGRTACLEHRIPYLAERADRERDRASCARALTLPGTNMICGGILAAEALRALAPGACGPPCEGSIVYDARFPQRFGVVDRLPACRHR